MEDRVLYAAAVISVFGLILLAYAGELLEPPTVSIGGIDRGFLEKNVIVTGNVTSVKELKSDCRALMVDDGTGKIRLFLSPQVAKETHVKTGDLIRAVGTVELYLGELEITLTSVERI